MTDWQASVSADVSIANDIAQALTYLQNKPGVPKAVIVYDGEEKRGEHEEGARVDRNFSVIVTRSAGLDIEGNYVEDDNSGGLPLYDLVEGCRDAVRGVRFEADVTEVYPNFKGISRFDVGEALFDAYKIEFSIGTQLDSIL